MHEEVPALVRIAGDEIGRLGLIRHEPNRLRWADGVRVAVGLLPELETLTRIVAAAGPAEAEATSRNASALPRPARAARMISRRDIAAPSGVSIGIAILGPPGSNVPVTAA